MSIPVFIFGGGAVGMALAVHLIHVGREVRLVRTSRSDKFEANLDIMLDDLGTLRRATVPCISMDELKKPKGVLVITAKAFANAKISKALVKAGSNGPIVLLQNGLGVERPFIEAGFPEIYRAVLYVTGERTASDQVSFHAVKPSVLGVVKGSDAGLQIVLDALTTPPFPFQRTDDIESALWKKSVVNCAFNSLCPLLDADNGIFAREAEALELARQVVRECIEVAAGLGHRLDEETAIGQVLQISSGSNHFISTLQDLRNGRPTEIDFLNLEVARLAASLEPPVQVPRNEMLGRIISLKSKKRFHSHSWGSD